MKNKRAVFLIIASLVILIVGASVLYSLLAQNASNQDITDPNQQGTLAPDFIVYDIDGNEVQLYDYIGKPIVLNFWASWCGPCQKEMPDFQEKYLEYGEEVQFLMVNMTDDLRETVGTASRFIDKRQYTFPVLYDTQSSADGAYGVYSLPTTYFIDEEGYIVTRSIGAIDSDTLQRGINTIIK